MNKMNVLSFPQIAESLINTNYYKLQSTQIAPDFSTDPNCICVL